MKKLISLLMALSLFLPGLSSLVAAEAAKTEVPAEAAQTAEAVQTAAPAETAEAKEEPKDKERFNLFSGIKQLEKRPFEFEEYKGKHLLVSFWTTWCPHCIKEMPEFKKFKEAYPNDVDILMVHVPYNSKIEDAKKMFEEKGLGELKLLEDDMTYAGAFGVQGFPTNFIFDKEGYLVSVTHATDYDHLVKLFQEKGLIAQ